MKTMATRRRELTAHEKAVQSLKDAENAINDAQYEIENLNEDYGKAAEKVRGWLDRKRMTLPGLTRNEVELFEELIRDLEAS